MTAAPTAAPTAAAAASAEAAAAQLGNAAQRSCHDKLGQSNKKGEEEEAEAM